MPSFILHPQLEKDSLFVKDMALCRVLLMNDARFPWLILVPRREGMKEIMDLLPGEQIQLMQEMAQVARIVQDEYKADKINIAALGNMVPQLHVHVIARFKNDEAWPRPVWGGGTAVPYGQEKARQRCEALVARL